jgi:hypothetical protein
MSAREWFEDHFNPDTPSPVHPLKFNDIGILLQFLSNNYGQAELNNAPDVNKHKLEAILQHVRTTNGLIQYGALDGVQENLCRMDVNNTWFPPLLGIFFVFAKLLEDDVRLCELFQSTWIDRSCEVADAWLLHRLVHIDWPAVGIVPFERVNSMYQKTHNWSSRGLQIPKWVSHYINLAIRLNNDDAGVMVNVTDLLNFVDNGTEIDGEYIDRALWNLFQWADERMDEVAAYPYIVQRIQQLGAKLTRRTIHIPAAPEDQIFYRLPKLRPITSEVTWAFVMAYKRFMELRQPAWIGENMFFHKMLMRWGDWGKLSLDELFPVILRVIGVMQWKNWQDVSNFIRNRPRSGKDEDIPRHRLLYRTIFTAVFARFSYGDFFGAFSLATEDSQRPPHPTMVLSMHDECLWERMRFLLLQYKLGALGRGQLDPDIHNMIKAVLPNKRIDFLWPVLEQMQPEGIPALLNWMLSIAEPDISETFYPTGWNVNELGFGVPEQFRLTDNGWPNNIQCRMAQLACSMKTDKWCYLINKCPTLLVNEQVPSGWHFLRMVLVLAHQHHKQVSNIQRRLDLEKAELARAHDLEKYVMNRRIQKIEEELRVAKEDTLRISSNLAPILAEPAKWHLDEITPPVWSVHNPGLDGEQADGAGDTDPILEFGSIWTLLASVDAAVSDPILDMLEKKFSIIGVTTSLKTFVWCTLCGSQYERVLVVLRRALPCIHFAEYFAADLKDGILWSLGSSHQLPDHIPEQPDEIVAIIIQWIALDETVDDISGYVAQGNLELWLSDGEPEPDEYVLTANEKSCLRSIRKVLGFMKWTERVGKQHPGCPPLPTAELRATQQMLTERGVSAAIQPSILCMLEPLLDEKVVRWCIGPLDRVSHERWVARQPKLVPWPERLRLRTRPINYKQTRTRRRRNVEQESKEEQEEDEED